MAHGWCARPVQLARRPSRMCGADSDPLAVRAVLGHPLPHPALPTSIQAAIALARTQLRVLSGRCFGPARCSAPAGRSKPLDKDGHPCSCLGTIRHGFACGERRSCSGLRRTDGRRYRPVRCRSPIGQSLMSWTSGGAAASSTAGSSRPTTRSGSAAASCSSDRSAGGEASPGPGPRSTNGSTAACSSCGGASRSPRPRLRRTLRSSGRDPGHAS